MNRLQRAYIPTAKYVLDRVYDVLRGLRDSQILVLSTKTYLVKNYQI